MPYNIYLPKPQNIRNSSCYRLVTEISLMSFQLYGKDGEYFALSQACFQHHADKYKYTVCPFKEVRQETSLGSPKIIGRSPAEWVLHGNYGNQLKMDRGDSIQCPGNQSRMSWVSLVLTHVLGQSCFNPCPGSVLF